MASDAPSLFGAEQVPAPPGAGPLAETLRVLLRDARATGERQKATLSHGLRLDVFHDPGGLGVALSRTDVPPDALEADIVAREAALPAYEEERTQHGGRHWIILRPPLPAQAPAPDPEDTDPDDGAIRRLLLSDGPWRNRILTPAMQEARAASVKGMRRGELREELAWARRRWGMEVERALVRAALANATPAHSEPESAMLAATPEVNRAT